MNASVLVDLYEAQQEQRNAATVARTSEDQGERDHAQSTVRDLESRIEGLQEQLWNGYTPQFVRCRDIGHVWDISSEAVDEAGVYTRQLTCYRCGTTRTDAVTRAGDIDKRAYKHARDYLMPKGIGSQNYGKSFWRGVSWLVASKKPR